MKRTFLGLLLGCAMALSSVFAFAQSSSSPAAKIVVGNQPGGSTDTVARLLAPLLSEALGRNFVVENRVGASGNIAAEHVARSAPDGDTILLIFNAHTTVGPLFPHLTFDPIKDFAPVGMISYAPYFVVARPDITAKDLKELVEQAKSGKQAITAGTPGVGTPQHLLLENFRKEHNIDIVSAHYKGSAPAQVDVIGKHIDLTLVTPTMAIPQLQAGNLKLLAVTSDKRAPDYPDVPTAREAGVESLVDSGVWLALLVPAATPAETVNRINQALNTALSQPETAQKLESIGMRPAPGTPAQLGEVLVREQEMWTKLIKESNISIN